MRNVAKCRLCGSVIESFYADDFVSCKCDEISVDGGAKMKCFAKNWNNFMRIDDEGNEIVVKIEGEDEHVKPLYNSKPTYEDLLSELDIMIENIDKLPNHAKIQPINHYDFGSLLLLLSSILRTRNANN